ncbi:MAG: gamma-glutamyl-gamma-aminobutyrate hydrolase family protein [Flavobacteriales bacterium]|jgi:putative glutamine amidotransferase|nr:gamma-glutamyl-gamma-aminobutyrate hydrolase family protein [Flavobacteriales bacterium]MBT5698929.1 gamma-glutamyl-gamma-aminobutyrate hydrolase family protein [Flavobacteriales bacterium]MBT6815475.1 gamma-glutamyl-gamma-aminobutyrate hydrolase family protein [Flavobacteriales bacterium]MBT7726514.1 gamma-glutamyl-gamma-aminobutyrate hydrolase family protein [Flavobacteriales bacterium]
MKKLLVLLLSVPLIGVGQQTIILSKASSNYIKWMEDENIIILDAYTIKNTDSILQLADGIILTGGEDINPLEYNNTTNLEVCGDINYERDTLERKLFDFALSNKIPLIGVCRGMQMMNVASGGTLYGDIPTEIGTEVIHRNNGEVYHEIALCDTSTLIFPIETDTIMVNSWHHQGLKIMPNHLRVIARSFDGLAEAIVMDKSIHPFMIAVQFHPERLGKDNVIHQTIRDNFFKEMKK